MKLVELGEVCNLKTGKTPPTKEKKYFNGNINWFNPSDLDKDKILVNSKRKITSLAFNDKKAVVFEKGSLLMTCIGEIGKVGITSEKCSSNQQITALIPSEKINVNFLFYCIKKLKPFLNDLANNAVVPILNNRILSSVKIPLFPLPEQKRIAYLLDQADKLHQLNKQLIEKYDELAQSIFLEMFGDPVTNPKGWEKEMFKDILEIRNGKNQKKVLNPNGKYPIYGSGGIMDYANEFISEANSVIIGRKGNINKPILVKEKYWHVDTAFGLNPIREKLDYNYLFFFCIRYNFEQHNKTVTIPSLTKTSLLNIKIPLPPLSLQTEFANRVALIEQQKTNVEQALQKSEDLFNCLLQKAFKDEV